MFNTSHNFDITIERTHACKTANELNKQLPTEKMFQNKFMDHYINIHICIR